jgi:hypothetical protein
MPNCATTTKSSSLVVLPERKSDDTCGFYGLLSIASSLSDSKLTNEQVNGKVSLLKKIIPDLTSSQQSQITSLISQNPLSNKRFNAT